MTRVVRSAPQYPVHVQVHVHQGLALLGMGIGRKKEKDNKWTQKQIKPSIAVVISLCAISQQITFISQKSFSGYFILSHACC
jgi:hypothetical protein